MKTLKQIAHWVVIGAIYLGLRDLHEGVAVVCAGLFWYCGALDEKLAHAHARINKMLGLPTVDDE